MYVYIQCQPKEMERLTWYENGVISGKFSFNVQVAILPVKNNHSISFGWHCIYTYKNFSSESNCLVPVHKG